MKARVRIVQKPREISSSSDDDRERTPPQICKQGQKRARRSEKWSKNVRKRRRNAGKCYMSDTTKKMVSPKLSRGFYRCNGWGYTRVAVMTLVFFL